MSDPGFDDPDLLSIAALRESGLEQAEEHPFWDARPCLRHLRAFAQSKYAAPWAVLGAVLARVIAATEPVLQLPDTIGNPASLNLFVSLVGASGSGKDVAYGIARRAVEIQIGGHPQPVDEIPLGSGEGLAHVYMHNPPRARPGSRWDEDSQAIGLGQAAPGGQPIQYRTRALVTVKEVDTLDSLMKRQGSTVGGQLRQAAMGDQLGFFYVDREKRMIVPEHSYRMCLIVGLQPGRGAALLGEADGGTPQRFVWLPAVDPGLPEDPPSTPPPLLIELPVYDRSAPTFLNLCEQARTTVIEAHRARQRGEQEALDGHALLTRLKVAAGLALLDRGGLDTKVTEQDWELAGMVMAESDRTRQFIVEHLQQAASTANTAMGRAEAHRAMAAEQTREEAGIRKAGAWAERRIGPEWVTERELRTAMRSSMRKYLPDALELLVRGGVIEAERYTASGQEGTHYRSLSR